MKRYETYKDSGVEWIGEIPEHWEIKRLKNIGNLYSGLSGKSGKDFEKIPKENFKPFINFTNVANNRYIVSDNFGYVLINEGENQNLTKKGDLFFLMSSENMEDVGKSAVLIDDYEELYLNSFCKGFRFNIDVNPIFINYFLSSSALSQLVSIEGRGFTRINLRMEGVENLPIFLPSKEEQSLIANYLNHKTAQLDSLIAKKEELISLLQEERTAMINQAVTKGLDPNVPMKDSGIEWLGDIPEHWMKTGLNKIIRVKDGTHESPKSISKGDNTFPLITSKDFRNGKIVFENAKHISSEDHYNIIKRSDSEKGDIIMSMIGGNIGNMVLIDTDKEFSIKNVCLFKTSSNEIIAKHLYYILKSSLLKIQIDLCSRGGAQGFLSLGDLRNLIYFVIPNSELKTIINYLDEETTRIDTIISKTQQEIELLKEYKTALISEVATGKVDVREEVLN